MEKSSQTSGSIMPSKLFLLTNVVYSTIRDSETDGFKLTNFNWIDLEFGDGRLTFFPSILFSWHLLTVRHIAGSCASINQDSGALIQKMSNILILASWKSTCP